MERDVRSERAIDGSITFYRAIEQLCSKGQQIVSFIVAEPKALRLCYLLNVITHHSIGAKH